MKRSLQSQKKEKRNLNIVQLFYARPHLGGSGISSNELAIELAKRDHNVHVVSYPGTYLTQEEKNIGLNIHPVKRIDYPCFKAEPYNATLASMVSNLYTKENIDIDIIHANYAITHGEAALMAKEIIKKKGGNPKVIITSRGSDIHTNGYHELLAPSLEHILSSADEITFNSQSLQEEAKKLFDLENYGKVIYNHINEEKFKPCNYKTKMVRRKELDLPKDATIIYHASNFRPLKQVNLLLKCAKQLKKEGRKDIIFALIGDGPEKSILEEQSKIEYTLNGQVRFFGKQENVLPYIHASDIAILPSKREAFGRSLIEPMACGLPVLGSNVGGIPEVINKTKSGFLFENRKNKEEMVYEMTHLIKKLVDNKELRRNMGISAKKRTRKYFSTDQGVGKYEKLYYDLLKK